MDRFYNSQLAIPEIKAKVGDLARVPLRATSGSAGFDLFANEDITLHVGEIFKVSTGVSLEIPEGFEGQVRSRSGLASKGVIVVNSPGTIDSDYRGEIKVLLMSFRHAHEIKKGDRIAQLVFAPVVHVDCIRVVDNLDETERGEGGFGSTGRQRIHERLMIDREEAIKQNEGLIKRIIGPSNIRHFVAGRDARKEIAEAYTERAGKYSEVCIEDELTENGES